MNPSIWSERTAVCITGELRTFLEPQVQYGFKHHFHYPSYDYFLSSDTYVPPDDFRLEIFIRNQTVITEKPIQNLNCSYGRSYFTLARRLLSCQKMIQHEEMEYFIEYMFFIHARTDVFFVDFISHPNNHVTSHNIALNENFLSMSTKENSHLLMEKPMLLFKTCTTRPRSYACRNESCPFLALTTYYARRHRVKWSTLDYNICDIRPERYSGVGLLLVNVSNATLQRERDERWRLKCPYFWES